MQASAPPNTAIDPRETAASRGAAVDAPAAKGVARGFFEKKSRIVILCAAGVATGILAISAYIAIRRFKRRYVDWPRHELRPLVTPQSMSVAEAHATLMQNALKSVQLAVGAAQRDAAPSGAVDFLKTQQRLLVAAYGRNPGAAAPLRVLRPFDERAPANYYGVVTISKRESATLHVHAGGNADSDGVSSPSYFEVVIYSQPDWLAVFSEVNISETPLDFLPKGSYAVAVFCAGNGTKGALEICENRGRPRPAERASRRSFSAQATEARSEGLASTVALVAPTGTTEILRVHSSPVRQWPPPVLSRIETVYAVVPKTAVAVYASVPAFGFVVDGEREHLQSVAHENNGAIIYRAIAQPPTLAGGWGATREKADDGDRERAVLEEEGLRVVSLTVVYPNICPLVASNDLHPKLTVFVFAPEVRPSARASYHVTEREARAVSES